MNQRSIGSITFAGWAFSAALAAEPVRVVGSESLVAARAAQFRAGDELLAVQVGDDAPRTLDSAFDFRLLTASRLLQQPLRLRVRRDDAEIDLVLADGVELLNVASDAAPDSGASARAVPTVSVCPTGPYFTALSGRWRRICRSAGFAAGIG